MFCHRSEGRRIIRDDVALDLLGYAWSAYIWLPILTGWLWVDFFKSLATVDLWIVQLILFSSFTIMKHDHF
jgi:hypothetical protein